MVFLLIHPSLSVIARAKRSGIPQRDLAGRVLSFLGGAKYSWPMDKHFLICFPLFSMGAFHEPQPDPA